MSSNRDVKQLSMNFLLDCAFGQHEDLITAAIDKAYVDMAAHTLKVFKKDEYNEKWACRYNATRIIREAIEKYSQNVVTFEEWHKKVIVDIKNQYDDRLQEGQAQKWLNMTIKYIFVLKEILGEDDERLICVRDFINHTDEGDYYAPIDSYILKGAKIKVEKSWSTMDYEDYEKLRISLGEEKDFLWEMESWGEFAKKYKENANESYATYIKSRENMINSYYSQSEV